MKNKRRRFLVLAACLTVMAALPGMTALGGEKPQYLKSVTYFGDEWPINFWGSEDENMDAHFEQIEKDGFNSVILAVPWREFQPETMPPEYNEEAFGKLDQIMECADRHGLWVVLRIGYTWDYCGPSELPERFHNVMMEGGADRDAWLRYSEKLYRTAAAHPNFYGGFITWEDFWDFTYKMREDMTMTSRVRTAARCGYTDYLKSHYTLLEVSGRYGAAFASFDSVYLPSANHPSAALFYEFYDSFLNGLLHETQEVFPGLTLEVRADGDVVYDTDGSYGYYSHSDTYPCEGANYVALMYSVAMGQRNESERITSGEALAAMSRNLKSISEKAGGKKLYIEQFLYMDTTEEYSYNAQIREDEVDGFIRNSAPVLRQATNGYGLWVYRNYVNNCVYNGQFGFGSRGWEMTGNASVTVRSGSNAAVLGAGESMSQNLINRLAERMKIHVRFTAESGSEAGARLTVSIGETQKTVRVNKRTEIEFSVPWQYRYDIEFSAGGMVYIDNVQVYTFEQDGQIYDKDGKALALAESFRALNKQLN